jgi:hypothetical protein
MLQRRFVVPLAVALTAFVCGTGTQAASGWRVFGSAGGSGPYTADAMAGASIVEPRSLAVRASMAADLTFSFICHGERQNVPAGKLVILSVEAATSCSVTGGGSSSRPGRIRVELLRR